MKEQARICFQCESCGWCDTNQELASEIVRIIRKHDDAADQPAAQEHKAALLDALKRV